MVMVRQWWWWWGWWWWWWWGWWWCWWWWWLSPDGANHCFQRKISCFRTQGRSIEDLPFFVFSYFKFFQVSEVKDAFTDLGNLFGHHVHLKKSHNIWFINQKSGKLWGRSMWEISSMGEKLKNTIEKKSPIWEKNGKKISPVLTKSSQPFLL